MLILLDKHTSLLHQVPRYTPKYPFFRTVWVAKLLFSKKLNRFNLKQPPEVLSTFPVSMQQARTGSSRQLTRHTSCQHFLASNVATSLHHKRTLSRSIVGWKQSTSQLNKSALVIYGRKVVSLLGRQCLKAEVAIVNFKATAVNYLMNREIQCFLFVKHTLTLQMNKLEC